MIRGLINNDWDRDNLNFLLALKGQEAEDWYNQSDADDKAYAAELLYAYYLELFVEKCFLNLEIELETKNDYTEAKNLIEKIKNAKH
jgi:hypothetical protein